MPATRLAPTPPDHQRRRLLLGLPSGLVIASPLSLISLIGCGGDDSSTVAPAAAPRNPVLDLPPGEVSAATLQVAIDLPPVIPLRAAQLISAGGLSAVSADAAAVVVFADGPQLATVLAADGTPLLMGWVGSGRPALSLHSTATVLLHFALGLPFWGANARDSMRQGLESHPATAALAARLLTLLSADVKALATVSPALRSALVDAMRQLAPPAALAALADERRQALGLKVEPASVLSGLQVVQGETLNSLFVDNQFVRRAVVIVNREAWVDAAGVRQPEPQGPVQVGEVMELPLPAAFDSIANTVGGWAGQYYAPDDPNGFFRSVSDTVTLDITPDAAKRTEYSVVVLMAGLQPVADAAAFARLPASQQAYIRGLDLNKSLPLKALLIDLLGPLFFSMLAEKLGELAKGKSNSEARKELMQAFAGTLLSILQSQLPDVVQKLSDGSTDAWTAFKTISKALTFDPDTGTLSPLLADALGKLAEFCAARLADAGLRSPLLEVATGIKVGGKGVLGILPVLRIFEVFDEFLGKFALARIATDLGRSRQMESFAVTATKAKVVLRPNPLVAETTGVSYPVKAEIVDNDNDENGVEKGSINFDWECSGRYGNLYSLADANLEKPNKFTSSKNFATPNYLPNGKPADGAAETISVKAYFEPIGARGTRQLIGSASTTVKFKNAFNLGINPLAPTDVPTDSSMGVTAFVKETLPEGSTAAWEWSHTGVGSIEVVPPHSNPNDSSVTFKTTSAEGTATVTARATFTIPATATTASRIVIVDPVSTTLTVKKGLKTLTVEGYFQLEQGSKPLAVPKCGLDAQGKEVCLLGYLDTWVTYIVPKVANAESYSIRLLNPAGGALYTYKVPSQYPIGGPVVQDGGGTLRIRFWGSDSPYGSYDGVSDYGITQATQSAGILSRARTELPRVVAVVTLKP